MVKFKPLFKFIRFPNFKLKIKLGALLLCLSLLGNYQPYFAFPPVKKSLVYAEITQESQVTPKDLGITFQLPHPGYLSTRFSSYHPGVDIASGLGMPVKPIAKGKISWAGFNFWGLGLTVEVQHSSGYKSLYAHLGKVYVEVGKEVDEGSLLGEVGLTGNTSGPHTHLEVFKDGSRINPSLILPEIRNYPKEEDFVALKSATPSAIAIPVFKPNELASASATPRPTATPAANPVKATKPLIQTNLQDNTIQPEPIDNSNNLRRQSLDNVLNLASPKPSSLPLPQGGQLSLRNFSIFGFKK